MQIHAHTTHTEGERENKREQESLTKYIFIWWWRNKTKNNTRRSVENSQTWSNYKNSVWEKWINSDFISEKRGENTQSTKLFLTVWMCLWTFVCVYWCAALGYLCMRGRFWNRERHTRLLFWQPEHMKLSHTRENTSEWRDREKDHLHLMWLYTYKNIYSRPQ